MIENAAKSPAGTSQPTAIDLSIVVPIYRCSACLDELYAQLSETLAAMNVVYEILLVDDASPDGAWELIVRLVTNDCRVRGFHLSRNFGQHAAVFAGLAECRGRWAVVMDGDLEDPPAVIPQLLQAARQGFDIVFARRRGHQQSFLRHLVSRLYFWFLNRLNKTQISYDYGNFSLISRKVIQAIQDIGDREQQYLFTLYWLGFHTTEVEFDRGRRPRGDSSYGLFSLIAHAVNGICFQTPALLQCIIFLGVVIGFGGSVLALVLLYLFVTDNFATWMTIVVAQVLLSGLIITCTGVVGLYIGRIFEQVKGRPSYVISDRAVFPSMDSRQSDNDPNPFFDSEAGHAKK